MGCSKLRFLFRAFRKFYVKCCFCFLVGWISLGDRIFGGCLLVVAGLECRLDLGIRSALVLFLLMVYFQM